MLSPQFVGAQGNLGARVFRLECEWPGHYDPRRGMERLGRILRRNFPIRGRTTAACEDHSWLPSSGGWLLVSSDPLGLQVAADCCRCYVQLLCDQTLRFAGLDPDRYQLATFGRGELWGSGISLRRFHLTFAVQCVRRLIGWFQVIQVPLKLDHVSLLIEEAIAVQDPPAYGLPALLINSKVPNRQASDFSVPQSFCDGPKGFVHNGACLLAGKVSVLFELRVHEDTDQVCAGHISLLCPRRIRETTRCPP